MLKNFDDAQKFGKENMDLALKSFGAVSKSMQAIAVEVADYSKKSFEDSTAAMEKLMGAKTLEKAIEVVLSELKKNPQKPTKRPAFPSYHTDSNSAMSGGGTGAKRQEK